MSIQTFTKGQGRKTSCDSVIYDVFSIEREFHFIVVSLIKKILGRTFTLHTVKKLHRLESQRCGLLLIYATIDAGGVLVPILLGPE